MIRSIVVLVSLDDLPVGPSSAIDLAQRIADEYGLAADAHISRYRLVVRVHRLDPIVEVDGRQTSTVAHTVKALARIFHRTEPWSPGSLDQTSHPSEGRR